LKSLEEETSKTEEKSVAKAKDDNSLLIIDVRTVEEFAGGAYPDAINIPLDNLMDNLDVIGKNAAREMVVYCASGGRSAYAQRMLAQAGYTNVKNGGGLSSMMANRNTQASGAKPSNEPIIIDVRSPQEFAGGAYPGAINIPLDDLMQNLDVIGKNAAREVVVYCASGGRSAYAQRMLMQAGYTNVKNGGGLSSMMANRNTQASGAKPSNEPIIIDVRTPQEFAGGAYPGAVNIPLDDLMEHLDVIGKNAARDIVVYCASGGRSAYAQRMLMQTGYTNVKNGGGLSSMMSRR
jgi:rhodanese-related sulfurtransferase